MSTYPTKNIELYAKEEEIARLKEAFANTCHVAEKSFENALAAKDSEISQLKSELSEWMSTAQRLHIELMEIQAKIDAHSSEPPEGFFG